MELMTYKTRAVRTLSLLILVALLAALNPPSITDSTAFAQAAAPTLTSSANTANQVDLTWTEVEDADDYELWRWEDSEGWVEVDDSISGTTYSDSGVTAGLTYYYQVSADGGDTWSNRVNETVGAYDASTLSLGTVNSSSISVSWSAVTGAASYELWRYENSWTMVGGGALTGTSHTDTTVEIGKTYYYQVMAKGPNGDGAWSNRVNATVPSTTPGAPINFNAAPGDAQVTLSWNAPTSDGGSAITGYQYRYQMSGGSWSNWMATSPAGATTATVTGLTNEAAHNFEVQAVNANGAGATASDTATPMSTVPDTPSGLGVTSTGPTEIMLSWTAVDGAASYQLQRRTNGGAWGSPMDAGSGTTYTDMDLDPSTTYDYEVRAVNAAGSSGWSGVVTSATTAPEAPDAVSDLAASDSADKITLTWTMPDSNGADITGYDLDVSDDGSAWSDLATKAAADTSHEHMNLGPGTMKYYRIRAMNSVGYSDWSASAMATVDAVAPGKPTLYASASGTTIMLSWVAPAATGGADITRYTIQVSNDGTTGWGALATKAADDTTHDHVLRPTDTGTTRYYRINAANSAGTGEWSDIASATTGGAAPPPGGATDDTSPRNLGVTPAPLTDPTAATSRGTSTAALNLTWLAPIDLQDDGDDTNTNPTYEVQVWNPATQTWGAVAPDGDGGDDDPSDLTLTDSGLKGVTDYTYRVRHVDGNSRGKWSAQMSGKTVAVSPSRPTLTATKMGTDKIVLTWTVPDDGGSDIIGYVLYAGTSANPGADTLHFNSDGDAVVTTGAIVLLEAPHQTITHSGLSPGTTWYYNISALNGVTATADTPTVNAAWSAASADATATTDRGVPGKATITVTPGERQLALAVSPLPATGDPAITTFASHEFQVYDAANDKWIILQDNATATYTFNMFGGSTLGNNVSFSFRARSKIERNQRIWSGAWSDVVTRATSPGGPSAPKLTFNVRGPNSITLSWTVPENNGGPDPQNTGAYAITDYDVEASLTGGPGFGQAAFDPILTAADITGLADADVDEDDLTATHSGLDPGDTLYYRVRAVNGGADGATDTNGSWSNIVRAKTSTGDVPAAPDWDATPLTSTASAITLNWDEVTGATGYDIAMWEDGEWVIIASNISSEDTAYQESGLSGATTYYFSVRARNASGAGPWSIVESIATQAGAPGKPVLTATPDGDKKIVLTWTAPDSGGNPITDYLVQVSNNGTVGWGPLDPDATNNVPDVSGTGTGSLDDATRVVTPDGAPAPPLTVTHSGLSGLTRKYYRVLASTDPPTTATNRGAWSDVKSARTPAGKPGAPTWPDETTEGTSDPLVVTASAITVAWEAPPNGGSTITGYQVQVWDDGAWMDLMSVGGSVTSYSHSGLPGATEKFYRVRAMNAVGYSDWSETHSGKTSDGMPGAPVLHADQNGASEIRLTWTAPATGVDSGGEIRNYHIQVSNDGQSGWTSPQTSTTVIGGERVHPTSDGSAADDTQNYPHSGLDPATTRYYRVRAVNNNTNTAATVGPWSNVAMATTTGDTPGRPMLTATASGTSIINLVWTPPAGDGGSAITGYELEYWDGSNGWMDLTNPAATDTAYTHRNIGGGTTKFYRIRAMNSGGTGAWSTTAYATTATTVPAPPTLTAMADGATKIKLTWTAGHDGGLAITGYELQDSTGRTGPWGDELAQMNMSAEDTGLTGGTTKYYRVRATNSKGAGGWSPLASATTDTSIPGKPKLTVGVLNGALYVSWATPPTPTGGSSIIRFELQIWDSANRRWVDEITTTSTAHLDSGLTNGKTYFYRVRAVNAMGDGPWSTLAGKAPAQ